MKRPKFTDEQIAYALSQPVWLTKEAEPRLGVLARRARSTRRIGVNRAFAWMFTGPLAVSD